MRPFKIYRAIKGALSLGGFDKWPIRTGYESYLIPLNRHPHAIFVEAQFDILTLVAILSSRYSSVLVLQMMF